MRSLQVVYSPQARVSVAWQIGLGGGGIDVYACRGFRQVVQRDDYVKRLWDWGLGWGDSSVGLVGLMWIGEMGFAPLPFLLLHFLSFSSSYFPSPSLCIFFSPFLLFFPPPFLCLLSFPHSYCSSFSTSSSPPSPPLLPPSSSTSSFSFPHLLSLTQSYFHPGRCGDAEDRACCTPRET